MRRILPAVVLLIAACSPGDTTTSSTTTSPSSTSSTGAVTTTSPADTTTSTAAATTTSTEATTTTTSTPATTVQPGNWASEPLVTASWGALGWWDGASWVQVEELTPLPVAGGESYQIALLGLQATTTGGPQTVVCDPLENIGVVLDHEELLGAWPGPYGVAISAPWTLTPHLVEEFTDDGTYSGIASQLLSERGLDVTNPVITQLLRVDLEGDGINETIAVAQEGSPEGFPPQENTYALVFMRKIVDGEVQTAILGESIVLDPDLDFFFGLTVAAVADLSGDGKMEMVIDAAYYEGLGVEVWEYVNDDLGPQIVLQQGCGS